MIITKQLRAEIRRRREPTNQIDGKEVPGSVPFLRDVLSTATDPHDRDDLLGELAGEYLRADLDDEHLLVQRERVANSPDTAVVWLGLAQSLAMRSDGADEARKAVAKGVEISRRHGALIRYALTCQADVARRICDSALFAQSLADLIADAQNQRENDCGLNEELVMDLPESFCTPELEQEYRRCLLE